MHHFLLLSNLFVVGFENNEVTICECQPAASNLITHGFFPCAPVRPTMAFSIDLLEFITLQSRNGTPNITSWAESLEEFWKERDYILTSEV